MGAADQSKAGEGFDDVTTHASEALPVDRSHNRDTLSSEAMTEMLREVQDAMLALDERLAALESAQGAASHDTSRLARGVVDMGDALARRVRALEQVTRDPPSILIRREPAPPIKRPRTPPPQHRLAWTAALVFALAIVLGVFWLMAAESVDHATETAATKPPVVVAPTPAPAPVVADTTPIVPPPPPHPASHTVTSYHHWTSSRSTSAQTLPAANSTTAPTGFGHYGPSPSTPAPAPASAPPHPST